MFSARARNAASDSRQSIVTERAKVTLEPWDDAGCVTTARLRPSGRGRAQGFDGPPPAVERGSRAFGEAGCRTVSDATDGGSRGDRPGGGRARLEASGPVR